MKLFAEKSTFEHMLNPKILFVILQCVETVPDVGRASNRVLLLLHIAAIIYIELNMLHILYPHPYDIE